MTRDFYITEVEFERYFKTWLVVNGISTLPEEIYKLNNYKDLPQLIDALMAYYHLILQEDTSTFNIFHFFHQQGFYHPLAIKLGNYYLKYYSSKNLKNNE
jgi:hypothetical protein